MTKILLGVAVLFVAGAAWWLIMEPGSKTSIPNTNNATTTPNEARYMDIESYVRTSISTLSPEPEVLGGTFYVTKIETSASTGTVEYEDGHNAYTADFNYTTDAEGKPTVTSFTVRE